MQLPRATSGNRMELMANRARISIWVTSTRGAAQIRYGTVGRYVSLNVNTLANFMPGQPIQPTSSPAAFWDSVIALVVADINAQAASAAAPPS